jgi:arylsulfatase A-like enzyme
VARVARVVGFSLASGILATVAACRPSTPPPPSKPDVVLIVVEALRADHVGAYGYAAPTTPHLDELAQGGVRFAAARATSSWTAPSVASMLTGLYPAAHGVDRPATALAEDVATMPAAFHAAGWSTAAISAHPRFVTARGGFDRGFDEFVVEHGPVVADGSLADVTPADPFLRSSVQVSTADVVTTRALEWIERHARAPTPYFLYLHYFDPHAGYFPPPEYATRFGVAVDDPLRGAAQWPLLWSTAPPERAAVATLIRLYDAEIARTDDQIGLLLDGIRARGRPTVLVVVGDHGEEFNDHGGLQHGQTLYDEVLRVPWIVAGPGIAAGTVVPSAVSLVSLWPTIAALVGAPVPADIDGPALLQPGTTNPPKAQNVFADLEPTLPGVEPKHRRAAITGKWKLLPTSPPAPSLFDLETDPLEQIGALSVSGNERTLLEVLLKVHDRMARTARARHPPRIVTE